MKPLFRQRLRVTGVVQGVGFRPHVYSLALRHALTGHVSNDSQGVLIELEGPPQALASFLRDLQLNPPPLASIEAVETTALEPQGDTHFAIHQSHSLAGQSTPVPPDIATCPDCLAELRAPSNRRFRYPFLNCTNCGPRFTIICDLPYDRPATTMANFTMCPACQQEYDNPLDRRFHAQPTACPICGPHLEFQGKTGTAIKEAALAAAQQLLNQGQILALKGIGGFHLACHATNSHAVSALRQRKGRGGKPFAVMARDLDTIRRYAEVSPEEAQLLEGRERPIVLLTRNPNGAELPEPVAPGQAQLGFFLPYSPLHHLLLETGVPLVMTSGNRSEEPIVRTNAEALERLAGLADGFLLHNRDIEVVCDDSVVRHNIPIRRSRGYAPLPVRLPFHAPAILAVGGELKATFCLTKGDRAYLSQHIGDMENLETAQAFERALDHMQRLFRVQPEAVACDLHPGYLSTQWARRFSSERNLPLIQVQHHHAHAASLMAEHNLPASARIITVAFDGTGYGVDSAIWGGEFLLSTYAASQRLDHLPYVRLPGGDAAIRKPYRTALAHLAAAGIPWTDDLPSVQACPEAERRILLRQLDQGLNSPYTSSAGRLFDAAASLLGIRHEVSYEAQGAMEMEALAVPHAEPWPSFPCWRQLLDVSVPVPERAGRFHTTIAQTIAKACQKAKQQTGINTVGLTGGVFQNALLLKLTQQALSGFTVLTHRLIPPNDGGLALGQAAAAASKLTGQSS